jgi:hypothetical protein
LGTEVCSGTTRTEALLNFQKFRDEGGVSCTSEHYNKALLAKWIDSDISKLDDVSEFDIFGWYVDQTEETVWVMHNTWRTCDPEYRGHGATRTEAILCGMNNRYFESAWSPFIHEWIDSSSSKWQHQKVGLWYNVVKMPVSEMEQRRDYPNGGKS